ncbi:MAG: hypothetical protein JXD21_05525 [Candidatus Omnitrophica bacterium]|nr:hypothetical protein [Candidatus Omnitrophota bacterium]
MGLYENFKDVVGVVQKLDNIELYQKILNIQTQALELSNSNTEKDKKIRELEKQLDDSQKMKFDGKFYYIEGEEYPYCPGCGGSKKRKTHLVIRTLVSSTEYKCPTPDCKFVHFVDNPHWNPPRYTEDNDPYGY